MLSLYFHRIINSAYPTMLQSRPMLVGLVLLAVAVLGRSQTGNTDMTNTAASRESGVAKPHLPEADERLSQAEKHFNAGRQFYFQDNTASARREFDAAIDALLNAPESL